MRVFGTKLEVAGALTAVLFAAPPTPAAQAEPAATPAAEAADARAAEAADQSIDWNKLPLDREGRSLGKLQNTFTMAIAYRRNEPIDRCMMVWHPPEKMKPRTVQAELELHVVTDERGFDVTRAQINKINLGQKRPEDRKLQRCLTFALMGSVPMKGVDPGQRFRISYPATLHSHPISYYREKYLNPKSPHHPRNWIAAGKLVSESIAVAPAARP